jgi:hypothetical protein
MNKNLPILPKVKIHSGMVIFFSWIVLSYFIGLAGSDRKIGFWEALLVSLFFSPVIGAIFTFSSKPLADLKREKEILISTKNQEKALKEISEQKTQESNLLISEELVKLKSLLDSGVLTSEEFEAQKKKLLGQ